MQNELEAILLKKEIEALWFRCFHSVELDHQGLIDKEPHEGLIELRDRLRDLARTLGGGK